MCSYLFIKVLEWTTQDLHLTCKNFSLPLEYQYLELVNLLHHHHSLFSFFCFEHSELNFYDNHKCKDALPETEKFHILLRITVKYIYVLVKYIDHSESFKKQQSKQGIVKGIFFLKSCTQLKHACLATLLRSLGSGVRRDNRKGGKKEIFNQSLDFVSEGQLDELNHDILLTRRIMM